MFYIWEDLSKLYNSGGVNLNILIFNITISFVIIITKILPMNEIEKLLFHDEPSKRQKWFELFQDPVWKPRYNYPLKDMREHAMAQLRQVTHSGIVSVTDFFKDPTNIFTAHENIGLISPSTCTKFTVHYNLFGGTIAALHTDRHKYLFPLIDKLDITGCFCLTQLGYGNNAVQMETTVTYDDKTKEFVINSPTTLSQKYWITNGAIHANYALVFGQTFVKGKNEGVNAFIVPVRDKKLTQLPGVEISDMGYKLGLNGVDNATLKFHNVRIPRVNMLNRYSDVNEKGEFTSEVKGIQQRFFKVTERLLSGRLCIASMSFGAMKAQVYITVKYAQQRLAVSENGKSQTPIMQYQLQQNALIPLISRLLALNMLHNFSKAVFKNPKGHQHELLSICCIDKTLIGWHGERGATIMRERCGGQGFLSANKFGDTIAGAHAAMTAEGDNRVLMVKIVKDMLTNISKGYTQLPQVRIDKITSTSQLESLDTLQNLLRFREVTLFNQLVAKMTDLRGKGKTPYEIMMKHVSDEMQDLATSKGERIAFEQALIALQTKIHQPKNKKILGLHFQIYAFEIILNNLSLFLFENIIMVEAAKGIKERFRELIKEAALDINTVVNSLNVPVHALYVPIAADYVKYNEQPYQGEVIHAKM